MANQRAFERSYHRHSIGAAVAFGIVNHAKCSNLWHISTCFFDICICIDSAEYKFAAALITISIIFVYSFINPNAFEVIQYRVIDTIGSTIAVAANYILVPKLGSL
jgi:hypothetical protein